MIVNIMGNGRNGLTVFCFNVKACIILQKFLSRKAAS